MRGFIIDPFNQQISTVEVASGIEGIYQQVNARPVTTVELPGEHTLWLDDEGLYREGQHFWHWLGASEPFCGIGLVLGFNPETGEREDADEPFKPIIEDSVKWIGDRHTLRTIMALGAYKEVG